MESSCQATEHNRRSFVSYESKRTTCSGRASDDFSLGALPWRKHRATYKTPGLNRRSEPISLPGGLSSEYLCEPLDPLMVSTKFGNVHHCGESVIAMMQSTVP
jgi:hypothetical protein